MFQKFQFHAIEVLLSAVLNANLLKKSLVGPEHLLFGLLDTNPDEISQIFNGINIDLQKILNIN